MEAAYGNLTERYVLPSATTRKAMRYDLWPSNAALGARFFAGAPFGPDRSWPDRQAHHPIRRWSPISSAAA